MDKDILEIIEQSKNKKFKIFYHNDADGRLSAAITIIALEKHNINKNQINIFEVKYQDSQQSFINNIKKDDVVFIVDFSFDPDTIRNIIDNLTKDLIIIDHHISAKEKLKNFDRKIYGEIRTSNNIIDTRAGCELCYELLMNNKGLNSEFILSIGKYDTWRHEILGEMKPLYLKYYTESFDVDKFKDEVKYLDNSELYKKYSIGKILYEKDIKRNKELCDNISFEFKLKGFEQHSVLAANTPIKSSLFFGDNMNKYDICMVYFYNGDKYIHSLYSKDIDVSIIAQSFGGGGHKGASGFILDKPLIK